MKHSEFPKDNEVRETIKNIDEAIALSARNHNEGSFEETVFWKNCHFINDLDIKELTERLSTKKLISSISFSNSLFEGKVSYFNSESESITVPFSMNFSKSHFQNDVDFQKLIFEENINFSESIFEKDVKFENLEFLKYFDLDGADFKGVLSFAKSKLSERVIFGKDTGTRIEFNGDVNFSYAELDGVHLWKSIFKKNVFFQNTIFKSTIYFSNSKFLGRTVIESIETIGNVELKENIHFENSEFNELVFKYVTFQKTLSLNNAKVKKITISNVYFEKSPMAMTNLEAAASNRETARFLKHQALKGNDNILALKFKSQEMQKYWFELSAEIFCNGKVCRLPEWFLLLLNTISNNNGRWWLQGFFFTIFVWYGFYAWFIQLRDGIGAIFSLNSPKYIKDFVMYFWLPNGFNGLFRDNTVTTVEAISLSAICVFILGKILIGYGIFQTISAFRKYSKE